MEEEEITQQGTVKTSVKLDPSLHSDAKKRGISFRKALEFGIRFLIAEEDYSLDVDYEYPKTRLEEKLSMTISRLNNLLEEKEKDE